MSERKLLVVDDDKSIRDMYEEAFGRAGYLVQSAESAEVDLKILLQAAQDAFEKIVRWKKS